MIRLDSLREGFALSVDEKRILIHTRRAPCIGLGQLEPSCRGPFALPRLKRGSFSFLHACKICGQGPSFVSMNFENRITADFSLENGRLKINFSRFSPEDNYLELRFQVSPSERIYGLGEAESPLDFKGRRLSCWHDEAEALPDRDRKARQPARGLASASSFPLPRFISTDHYSCEVDCDSCVLFDFSRGPVTSLKFYSIPREISICAAAGLPELMAVTAPARRQPCLPDWAFEGAWLGFEGSPECRERKLKAVLDAGTAVSGVFCGGSGNSSADAGMEGCKSSFGLRRLIAVSPEFVAGPAAGGSRGGARAGASARAAASAAFREAEAGGFLVRAPEGGDYLVQGSGGPFALLDLTNPDARDWMRERIAGQLRTLQPAALDASLRLPLPADARLCAPLDSGAERNRWPERWVSLVREAMEEAFGPEENSGRPEQDGGGLGAVRGSSENRAANPAPRCILIASAETAASLNRVDLYRSSLARCPRSDCRERLFDAVPAALSLGCSGVGFWHAEVRPGSGRPELWRDAFLRCIEMAAFSPVFRVGDEAAAAPGRNGSAARKRADEGAGSVYGDPLCLAAIARFSLIHAALKSYHLASAREYAEKGLPLIRPVSLHYENEPELCRFDHQYLYGRDLLVAPVVGKQRELTELFLPDDSWVHIWSSRRFGGGKVIVDSPLGCPAVFYRASSPFAPLFDSIRKSARGL